MYRYTVYQLIAYEKKKKTYQKYLTIHITENTGYVNNRFSSNISFNTF